MVHNMQNGILNMFEYIDFIELRCFKGECPQIGFYRIQKCPGPKRIFETYNKNKVKNSFAFTKNGFLLITFNGDTSFKNIFV